MASSVLRPSQYGITHLPRAARACLGAPHIRPSNHIRQTYHKSRLQLPLRYQTRAFSSTPRPQYLEPLLSTTSTLLQGLHAVTCTPWALTLPLAALLVRLAITLSLSISSRRALQTRLSLSPLLAAWTHRLRAKHMARIAHLGPVVVERTVKKELADKQTQIYKRWGCERWKPFLPLLQLPVWLVLVETIRRMCGTHKGLLGLVTDWSSTGGDAGKTAAASGTSSDGLVQAVASVDVPLGGLEQLGGDTTAQSVLGLEPSMATEGILWFTDLTAPDPMLILPFMLSASMLLNIFSKESNALPYAQRSKGQQRLTRALAVVALAAGPLTLQLPSAILVYWISSGLLGYGQFVLLRHLMPMKAPITPQRLAQQIPELPDISLKRQK